MARFFNSVMLFSALIGSTAIAFADESQEPPLKYKIFVDQKSTTVTANQPTTLPGKFENPTIRIVPEKFREFPYMGVKFTYPSSFVFEANLTDTTSKSWTLTGNDLSIMLFELEAELSTIQFADSMIREFGTENAKIGQPNITNQIGDLELPGTQLDVKIGSSRLQMKIVKLPSKAGKTKLLVFQDNIDENGKHSREGARVMALIRKSFSFEKR